MLQWYVAPMSAVERDGFAGARHLRIAAWRIRSGLDRYQYFVDWAGDTV